MAQSEIRLPDGSVVQGNWATEDTLDAVLQVLEKAHGKRGRGAGSEDKARSESAKSISYNSKAMKKLSQNVDDLKAKFKDGNSKLKNFARSNEKAAESIDILSDTSGIAGRAFKGLSGRTADAADELDKLDGSVKGANDAFFKVVGSAGALGSAFGVVAGIIDQFAEFQTQAIQTGFSFSQELVNTRGNIAGLGMNMKQLSDILVTNGEAVRSLGGNSSQSANSFIDLVGEIKTANRQFGLFGMTTEEIAGLTAERLDVLRRQGFVEDQAYNATVESFQLLNHEVLAYSRMTGRERREIMRNNLAMREGNELLLSDLSKLGPNATTSFDSMMQGMSAVFGASGDEMAGIFTSMVESHFMGGMERLSSDQLAALGQIPGLRDVFEEARDQFIQNADNPAAMRDIQLDFAQEAGTLIQTAMDKGLVQLARVQEDSPVGELLRSLIGARQSATNFLNQTADEIREALGGVDANEAELLMIRDRIQILQNEFQAMLVSAFTFGGKAEDLANEENFKKAQEAISNFGERLSGLMDFFASIGDLVMPDGSGEISNAFVGGISAMFTAQGAVMLAMVGGVRSMWSLANGILTGKSTATGAASTTSKGGAKTISKRLPVIGTAIGAGLGLIDKEYKDAGYGVGDRAVLGVVEGALDLLDIGANLTNSITNGLIGTDLNTDIDLGGGWKDWVTGENVKKYNTRNEKTQLIPAFDPKSQRINTDNMIVKGATVGESGSITPSGNLDPSTAWRFSEEQLAKMTAALEENNRLMRRQTDVIENQ